MRVSGTDLVVTPSIGIASFSGGDETIEGLLRAADAAMYVAKERGRNTYHIADTNERAVPQRLRLEQELRHAIAAQQFVLYFQPQVSLASGRVEACEALLRWRKDDGTMGSPGQCIPILEDTGQIVAVGEWVLHEACSALRAWRERGRDGVRVSVAACAGRGTARRGSSRAVT